MGCQSLTRRAQSLDERQRESNIQRKANDLVNTIVAGITKSDEILGIIIGSDTTMPFPLTAAVNMVNDQAAAISTTDAALEPVSFQDAIRRRFAAFASHKLSTFLQTLFTTVVTLCRRAFAACHAQTFGNTFAFRQVTILAISLKAFLAKHSSFSGGHFPTRMAQTLGFQSFLTTMIHKAERGKTGRTAHMAFLNRIFTAGNAELLGFESLLPLLVKRMAFGFAGGTSSLSFNRRSLATHYA